MKTQLIVCAAWVWLFGGCHAAFPYSSAPVDAGRDALPADAMGDIGDDDAPQPVSGLDIVEIFSGVHHVYRGEWTIKVYVRVRNTLKQSIALDLVTVYLRSDQESYEVQFSVKPSSQDIPPLQAGAAVDLLVVVDVGAVAPLGTMTLSARVEGNPQDNSGIVRADSDESRALLWQVVEHMGLEVTTLVDEIDLDPQEPPPSLEDAKQGTGVSLREAIWLANTPSVVGSAVPVITFSPKFGNAAPVLFYINDGGLPPLRTDGTQIDGMGIWVVISGAQRPAAHKDDGLLVEGDDITLRGIRMADFTAEELPEGQGLYCLRSQDAQRVRIVDSQFSRCGSDTLEGAQVALVSGSNHHVFDCHFADGVRDGLRATDADYVNVRQNVLRDNGDDGLQLVSGEGHQVLDNKITGHIDGGISSSPSCAVELDGVTEVRVAANEIIDNQYGIWLGPRGSSEVRIVTNVLNSLTHDVDVDASSRAVTISRNRFSAILDRPIRLDPDANDGVEPPLWRWLRPGLLEVETSDGGAGIFEAYARMGPLAASPPAFYVFVSGTTEASTYTDFEHDPPIERPYLLFTNSKGSTSELTAAE